MTANQIGAVTTLIFIAVFYIGTPLWAERRGRNWKLWLVLAFLFPVISLIALFLLPNKKRKGSVPEPTAQAKSKPVKLETVKSVSISEKKVQAQPILDTTKMMQEVVSSEPSDDAMDDVLADFEDMLMSKSVLHGLGIKGLVGVRLQAEKYDDDGAESYKCWIIVESSAIKKLSADLNEQVSDTVQDFVRENDFDNAMSEAGFDPDLFNWWPVRVENVGVNTSTQGSPMPEKGTNSSATTSSSKKTYTEEFKKEVVHTALTAGTSLSEIARMYEVNLTLVRNWKAKYEADILSEIGNKITNSDNIQNFAVSIEQNDDVSEDEKLNNVLGNFEDAISSSSGIQKLNIKGFSGVQLQAEKYDDDGVDGYKCWIIVESTVVKKLSEEINEQVSDLVQDFVRDNGFNEAISEIGFDPDLFNWWPVRVEKI